MTDYIEREAAIMTLCYFCNSKEEGFCTCADKEQIMGIPTADVVKVRQGEWLERHRSQKSPEGYYYWNTPLKTVFVCSECGRHEDKQEPYCHCGAKMDGGTGR